FGNGLSTRLETASAPTGDPAGLLPNDEENHQQIPQSIIGAPATLTTQDKIAAERLTLLQRQNERERIEDAVRRGRLVDATAAEAATGRQAVQLITKLEGKLSEVATEISAAFKVPQRDVAHMLQRAFRGARSDIANQLVEQSTGLPATVDFDLES
ncbi:MAG: hypothetical protein Q8M07_07300, partial [Prosthecobacter sp.]|nr:hypothetical protein [Prosthecobacter sp.]